MLFPDESPLLLCKNDTYSGDALADMADVSGLTSPNPLCINPKDLQVYIGKIY